MDSGDNFAGRNNTQSLQPTHNLIKNIQMCVIYSIISIYTNI